MTYIIIVFGILMLLAGLIILINPETIFAPIRDKSDKLYIHIFAVVMRMILGVLLISQSGLSRYPLIIEVLGWLSIIAAIVLAVIGRRNFKRLMSWAFSLLEPWGRAGGVLATVFGAFLVYAFIQ
jgi:hypothetical protein